MPVGGGFFGVVQVFACLALAGFGVGGKQVLQLANQVVVDPEMAEVLVALRFGLGLFDFHFLAVVAVKAVTFNNGVLDALAREDARKGTGDGGGAGARRAGDGDDGVTFRHGSTGERKRKLTGPLAATAW